MSNGYDATSREGETLIIAIHEDDDYSNPAVRARVFRSAVDGALTIYVDHTKRLNRPLQVFAGDKLVHRAANKYVPEGGW